LNVRAIEVVSEVGELVDYKLLPNSRVLGPRLGKLFPHVRQVLATLDPFQAATTLQRGGVLTLEADGATVTLDSNDIIVQTESRGGLAVASDKGVTVAVDTTLTPQLIREGYARDLVRVINAMRKDAGLALNDRIHLRYAASGETAAALHDFAAYIQQETLALSLVSSETTQAAYSQTFDIGDSQVTIALDKA
jgi:isoleucyl-tRNA synthetase